MAEWGFRDLAERKELWQFTVSSAGVAAVPGSPPTQNTLLVLSERGIDASEHRATLLNANLIQAADVVLGMTGAHVHTISNAVPRADEKTFLLKKFAPDAEESDIPDPFGLPLDDYRQCLDSIQSCFGGLMAYLLEDAV